MCVYIHICRSMIDPSDNLRGSPQVVELQGGLRLLLLPGLGAPAERLPLGDHEAAALPQVEPQGLERPIYVDICIYTLQICMICI